MKIGREIPKHFPLGGGRFEHLTNHCYEKKVTETAVTISLAACFAFGQLAILEIL